MYTKRKIEALKKVEASNPCNIGLPLLLGHSSETQYSNLMNLVGITTIQLYA